MKGADADRYYSATSNCELCNKQITKLSAFPQRPIPLYL